MPDEHARLSPSASERWINCPASLRAAEALPQTEEQESIYAAEGTLAHTLAEITAGQAFGLISHEEFQQKLAEWERAVPDEPTRREMEEHVSGYVEFIRDRLQPGSALFTEQRLPTGVPESFGTSDSVIVAPTTVEIIDFKYGAGVPVSAEKNSQLRLYASGALDEFGDLLGTTTHVTMTIYQPRLNSTSSETLTVEALQLWREEVAIPAAEEALYSPKPRFGPSDGACRWCPLAGLCRERMEWATRRDFGDVVGEEEISPEEPATLSPTELSRALPRLKSITSWAKDVEATALDLAYSQGVEIPGYKVVRSGGQRKFTDETAAIQTLIDKGYNAEDVADFKIKGFGVIDKLLGKSETPKVLGEFIGRTEGRESLVPLSDKREAITNISDAQSDFSGVGQ